MTDAPALWQQIILGLTATVGGALGALVGLVWGFIVVSEQMHQMHPTVSTLARIFSVVWLLALVALGVWLIYIVRLHHAQGAA